MAGIAPVLLMDLEYAVGRYGLTLGEVPTDMFGMTIVDRFERLLEEGESYGQSEFRRHHLRSGDVCVWKLFPENPATVDVQMELMDELSDLMRDEERFIEPTALSPVRRRELPRAEHVSTLEGLIRFIDGDDAEPPEVNDEAWEDTTLFAEAVVVVPGYREAQEAARVRQALVEELASGDVPPVSAAYVRKLLDSEQDGLRNADIALAGYRVATARLRDAAVLTLDTLRPHYETAERIRQIRDQLDEVDAALHWPGPWQTAPALEEPGVS